MRRLTLILLDTQSLDWWRHGNRRLGRRTRSRINRAAARRDLAVSAISFMEIRTIKERRRRDPFRHIPDVSTWRQSLLNDGVTEIPIDGELAIQAAALPGFHGDPADRLIVATALQGHLLITSDEEILSWPGLTDHQSAYQ